MELNKFADENKMETRNLKPEPVIKNYHPLIGRKITSPALKDTVIFESVFNSHEPDFLGEHIIYGQMISPGAAHMAMILSAAFSLKSSDLASVSIEDVSFTSPLIVEQEKERNVQIILENTSDREIPFRIVSSEAPHEDWELHCEGCLIFLADNTRDGELPEFSPGVIPKEFQHHMKSNELYEKFIRAGYQLGPHFQCIEQGWHGDSEGICVLKTGAGISPSLEIHPGLIDSVFQSLMLSSLREIDEIISKEKTVIPLSLGSLKFCSNDFTDRLWIYTRSEPKGDISEADIAGRNADGKLVFEIRNFILKTTDKNTLFKYMGKQTRFSNRAPEMKSEIPSGTRNRSEILHELENALSGQRTDIMLAFLMKLVKKVSGNDKIIPGAPLNEQGIDSRMMVDLRNRLAEETGKRLPVSLLYDYPVPEDLSDHILKDILQFDSPGFEPVRETDDNKERVRAATDFLDEIESLI